jgi:hypothetical protein
MEIDCSDNRTFRALYFFSLNLAGNLFAGKCINMLLVLLYRWQ